MSISETDREKISPDPPVNYLYVKLHDVHNLPPNWVSDARPPAYVDHPFRYEVSFSVDGETTHTFTHGRLLQLLPSYAEYISSATPLPLSPAAAASSAVGDLRPLRDVPDAVDALSADDAAGASAPAADDAAQGARLLWLVTPAADALPASEEPTVRRRTRRGGGGQADEAAAAPPLPGEDEAPPCAIGVPLRAADVAALETMLVAGHPLEMRFARVLRAGLPGDWEDMFESQYRATIAVSLAPLGEVGALSLTATVPLNYARDGTPVDVERTAKKRMLKRAKTGVPGLLVEEINPEGPHPYEVNNTSATVSLRLESTLVRLASERVRPALKPCNLIPTRAPPHAEYQDSTRQFGAAVKAIAAAIAQYYAKVEGGNDKNGSKTGEKMMCEIDREKLFELFQTEGQLASYKEQLKPLVVKVAREKFLREPGASRGDIAQVTNELYVYLLDCIHATLRDLTDKDSETDYQENSDEVDEMPHDKSNGGATQQQQQQKFKNKESPNDGGGGPNASCPWAVPAPPRPADVVWLERAQEAETLRDFDAAARFHQARIASCTTAEAFPSVWNDAGEFFLRAADTLRAEQCYREGIACDPAHVSCLIGYGALLLASERFDEAGVYLHAAADLAPGVLPWGYLALLCDLRVLALEHGPRYEVTRAHLERDRLLIVEEARAGSGGELDFNMVVHSVAVHLLQLCQPDLANVCLARCLPGPQTELLYARLFEQCEKYEEALKVIEGIGTDDEIAEDVEILRADCLAALGRNEEAVRAYKSVLCRTNSNSSDGDPYAAAAQTRFGRWYVHLGNLLITAGRYNDALGVFTIGIQAWPCSLMWLGAGIAYYRLGKYDAAEECLSESNTLNKTNPRTWGYLALVCMRKDRAELELVLQQAVTQGLTDAALFAELGRDLVRASRAKMGEACLRKALALEREAGRGTTAVSCITMYHLANALESEKRLEEAKEMYDAVVKHSQNEVLKAKAEEQLVLLAN